MFSLITVISIRSVAREKTFVLSLHGGFGGSKTPCYAGIFASTILGGWVWLRTCGGTSGMLSLLSSTFLWGGPFSLLGHDRKIKARGDIVLLPNSERHHLLEQSARAINYNATNHNSIHITALITSDKRERYRLSLARVPCSSGCLFPASSSND